MLQFPIFLIFHVSILQVYQQRNIRDLDFYYLSSFLVFSYSLISDLISKMTHSISDHLGSWGFEQAFYLNLMSFH